MGIEGLEHLFPDVEPVEEVVWVTEDNRKSMVFVHAKSRELGKAVRLSEEDADIETRKKARTAWVEFRDSLDSSVRQKAVAAYYKGYAG